jgi:hypothetical protein
MPLVLKGGGIGVVAMPLRRNTLALVGAVSPWCSSVLY